MPALRHIPVIMISAVDEIDSVVRCIELGAEDYLPKPFNPTLLRARVGACSGAQAAARSGRGAGRRSCGVEPALWSSASRSSLPKSSA